MRNKEQLKKYIFATCLLGVLFLIVIFCVKKSEYREYNKNVNKKISSLVEIIKDKYPNVSEDEIIEDVLKNGISSDDILKKYSIDIDEDNTILQNECVFERYMVIEMAVCFGMIGVMVVAFLIYNHRKDKEINKITKCIQQINKKNYTLDLDGMSEDELSILKNEIYKTTIMLKEDADNSKKDKIELKDSLADISHQIKTPITSVLIILNNLIEDPDMDEELRNEFVRDIKREILNVKFFIQTILELSKLDTGTVSYNTKSYDISDIILEVKQNLSMLSDLKNVAIEYNIDDKNGSPKLLCDKKWEVEAISNIVKNCIEHSKEGSSVQIEVKDCNVYLKIVIKDTGEGIDKKDLPHLFERFYNGKNAHKDSVGIGLALAKTIIEKDNGKIDIESDGNGTTFTIKYYNI